MLHGTRPLRSARIPRDPLCSHPFGVAVTFHGSQHVEHHPADGSEGADMRACQPREAGKLGAEPGQVRAPPPTRPPVSFAVLGDIGDNRRKGAQAKIRGAASTYIVDGSTSSPA